MGLDKLHHAWDAAYYMRDEPFSDAFGRPLTALKRGFLELFQGLCDFTLNGAIYNTRNQIYSAFKAILVQFFKGYLMHTSYYYLVL